jgi:hypothetical protein
MDIFILYLLMQANSIKGMFVVITVCLVVGALVSTMIGRIEDDAYMRRLARLCCIAVTPMLIFATLLPSTKTLAVMMGWHYAIEAVKSDTAKKILDLVDLTIDGALSDAKKAKASKK